MKYKVGDKVFLNLEECKGSSVGSYQLSANREYTISFIAHPNTDHPYHLEELGSIKDFGDMDFIIKNNQNNNMKKLNNLFKKLTDPSVQSLSEAGILNGDLELTEEGKKELMTILFLANKEALVARAEEIIREAKEDK